MSEMPGVSLRRISSRNTFFLKRVFPMIWFGGIAFFVLVALRTGLGGHGIDVMVFVLPLFMAAIGVTVMKKLVWDLVDEVWDGGDYLLVRNGKEEDRIRLAEIMNVSYVTMQNPNRVTLSLRQPCRFGTEISFAAPSRFGLTFSKHPIIDELIQRIDQARRAS